MEKTQLIKQSYWENLDTFVFQADFILLAML